MNGEGKNQLKKGPWTAEEDEMLMQHVRKYGEGRWSAVQKHSGLARCGKSCRLRWANHLRPDLKKGSFTPDEEKLILELQDKYGNKWARIAAELPGRTDNEIKNFWNSRLKRRLRDVDRNQGQQYYSSQPTTPTTSSDFQFQVLSSPLPPKSHLASNSSSSLPYTIKRPPPLLSSPSWFERQRRLSSASDETLLNTTGFTASPSMSTSSFLYSSPTTTSSGLLSPLRSQNSPMLSPLFSSSSQPASPTLAFSSMPNSSITPHSPTLFSTLSQPSSARITSLTSPHSPMLSSRAGSQALCSPGSPILSLVGSTSSMYIPGENSSISLIRNQRANELSGTSSFLFDGLSSYAPGYLHNPELPSNQISGMSSEFTLDQNVNLAKMHSYDVLIEDPSQSDVILDLKMKAGWTPGLKRKPRLDVAPASKINMAMTRAADESSMVHMSKVNGESMNEQTRPEVTFDQGQSPAELQDSCGSFEDMFKQSQAMESAMISGSESCLVFTEEQLFLEPQNDCINFSPLQSSAGDNFKEEQTLEQMNSMHEDLSKLLGFDPASFAVPELYTDCSEISDKQYSDGTTDNNFNDELS